MNRKCQPTLFAAVLIALVACACSGKPDHESGHKELRDGLTVVWLEGSPFEMGQQQGQLLRDELAEGVRYIGADPVLQILFRLSERRGLLDLARSQSDEAVLEECRGMVETAGDVGWTMDMCLLLAFGDVAAERLRYRPADPGCSQFVVHGAASKDGRLYHGRLMDWFDNQFILDHPTLFVRRPADGIPHVSVAWPGAVTPFTGINAHGLSIAMNNAAPREDAVRSEEGLSHQHLMARLLSGADTLAAAEQMIASARSLSTESIVIADGKSRRAAAFEMTFDDVAMRSADDNGVLYQSNHFVAPRLAELDLEPAPDSSLKRFDRLAQLLDADALESSYATIDKDGAVEILRDRIDPWTKKVSSEDVFDDDSTLATNGALLAVVFAPESLEMWVAGGARPVPSQTFVHFSVAELFEGPQ